MQLEFRSLSEVASLDLIELMNHPLVRRQMPLLTGSFTEADCAAFVAAKEQLWRDHGYGPWAFFIDGAFAGWGGMQPEGDDADLGLVLHPSHWGRGGAIYDEILRRAFGEMGLPSITVLLPPSRTRLRGMERLAFERDGELEVAGKRFLRFRLTKPPASTQAPGLPTEVGITTKKSAERKTIMAHGIIDRDREH